MKRLCSFLHHLGNSKKKVNNSNKVSSQLFPLKPLQTQLLVLNTFWLSFLILLSHYYKISTPYLLPFLNYWTWTNTTSRNMFFCSNPYIIEVIITFLVKLLELPNFGQMTNHIYKKGSRDFITFLSSCSYFKEPWSNQFCWHHQNPNQLN